MFCEVARERQAFVTLVILSVAYSHSLNKKRQTLVILSLVQQSKVGGCTHTPHTQLRRHFLPLALDIAFDFAVTLALALTLALGSLRDALDA
jgi:hypothetical protein